MPTNDKPTLDAYYKMLNLAEPMVERVSFLISEMTKFSGEPIEYVFIENLRDGEGNESITNVICLSKTSYQEGSISGASHKFVYRPFRRNKLEDFDSVIIQEMHDMTFEQVDAKSRLMVSIALKDNTYAWFTAAGLNCQELLDMVKKYFWPNEIPR